MLNFINKFLSKEKVAAYELDCDNFTGEDVTKLMIAVKDLLYILLRCELSEPQRDAYKKAMATLDKVVNKVGNVRYYNVEDEARTEDQLKYLEYLKKSNCSLIESEIIIEKPHLISSAEIKWAVAVLNDLLVYVILKDSRNKKPMQPFQDIANDLAFKYGVISNTKQKTNIERKNNGRSSNQN